MGVYVHVDVGDAIGSYPGKSPTLAELHLYLRSLYASLLADPAIADPEQFGAVFDRYFGEIHGYAARRVGRDAAADIAAEVFLTAFRLRRRFVEAGFGKNGGRQ